MKQRTFGQIYSWSAQQKHWISPMIWIWMSFLKHLLFTQSDLCCPTPSKKDKSTISLAAYSAEQHIKGQDINFLLLCSYLFSDWIKPPHIVFPSAVLPSVLLLSLLCIYKSVVRECEGCVTVCGQRRGYWFLMDGWCFISSQHVKKTPQACSSTRLTHTY